MPQPRIFHLTSPQAWEAARRTGELVPAGFAAEGFVHCSSLEQLQGTLERHFGGVDELVLLELDPAAIATTLRWEESRPGERYPHLYRPLQITDVTNALAWHRGPDGEVELPVGLG